MTPDQYRREGAEAMREACIQAVNATASPIVGTPYSIQGQEFTDAVRAIDVDKVLAGLPPATSILDMISAEEWQNMDATQDNICVQAGRPCTDCGQTHDTDGDLCPTCVCVRAEIAAMEKDHD